MDLSVRTSDGRYFASAAENDRTHGNGSPKVRSDRPLDDGGARVHESLTRAIFHTHIHTHTNESDDETVRSAVAVCCTRTRRSADARTHRSPQRASRRFEPSWRLSAHPETLRAISSGRTSSRRRRRQLTWRRTRACEFRTRPGPGSPRPKFFLLSTRPPDASSPVGRLYLAGVTMGAVAYD